MKALQYKEWKLAMSPVPFFFLALSGLLLIPNYPYYVTFFYNGLGLFSAFSCFSSPAGKTATCIT